MAIRFYNFHEKLHFDFNGNLTVRYYTSYLGNLLKHKRTGLMVQNK